MRVKGRHVMMAAAVALCAFGAAHEAQALRLSMKRIIFEGPKRSDIITIMNNTAKAQTYRLGWRHYRMDEKRSLVFVKDEDEAKVGVKWADDMIRYAPRRVTVPPGGTQQVRLLLRRPASLEAGEYRSHLWIITESDTEDFSDQQKPDDVPEGGRSVKLTMQPALTLPVFVRYGELAATASIDKLKISQVDGTTSSISFDLMREGNRSLYGDVRIVCTGSGSEFEAKQIRGIAIYTEVTKRILDFDFHYPAEQASNCRKVRVEYIADREDTQYKGKIMAQAVSP